MINIPKGTKDVLPEDSYKWQYIENAARNTAELFNAKEIRTPVFEHTEVFLRGVGETTDVVNKEMYTFNDKGGRSVTLKPEGTAGIARAFIENGLFSKTLPMKAFYLTPCFRYERPQAGRLREFHQFGVEIIGSKEPTVDAEAILLAKKFLSAVGVHNVTLYLNSIGCKTCRKEYEKALKKYFEERIDSLCGLCRERLYKNPMRLLDCKNDECKKIAAGAPSILDYVCDDCRAHFEKVKELISASGVEFEIDPGIVRGLDYYTKTVFEFVSDALGAKSTVCGGGRYDGLISELGGNDAPGVGFAVGIERLLLLMENSGVKIPEPPKPKVYFAPMGEEGEKIAFGLTFELREKGVIAETDLMKRSVKANFKYADKIGAEFVGVIGDNEIEKNVVKLKNMRSGEETEVGLKNVCEFFGKRL